MKMVKLLRSLFTGRKDKGLVGYRCPQCAHFFFIPGEIVRDFSPQVVKSIMKEEKVTLIAPVVRNW